MHGKELRELICACLLGDGSLTKNKRKQVYFQMTHKRAQKDFLEWKVGLVNSFLVQHNIDNRMHIHDYEQKVNFLNHPYPVTQSSLSWQKFLPALYENCYPYFRHRSKNFEYLLAQTYSPLHLAIWFGDDGNEDRGYTKNKNSPNAGKIWKRSPRYRLAVCSLTHGEINLVCNWLNHKFGLNPRICYEKRKNNRYPILRFTVKDSERIFQLIAPYFSQIESMRYKFRWSFEKYEIKENGVHPI